MGVNIVLKSCDTRMTQALSGKIPNGGSAGESRPKYKQRNKLFILFTVGVDLPKVTHSICG